MIIHDDLSSGKHIKTVFGGAYRMLIITVLNNMDNYRMGKMSTTIMRPKVEAVWSPRMKKYIKKLERMQRITNKSMPEVKELTHEEGLKEMQLMTWEERWKRGDLIPFYELGNQMERMDNEGLLVTREEES